MIDYLRGVESDLELVPGVFVAREGELGVLERAAAGCQDGGGSALVVAGEAGVGKSRLLAEASRWARGAGMVVLRGRAASGFAAGSLDFVFIDHDKSVYVSDLELILGQGWLHPGSVVVADNVKFPGAPEYRAYLEERQDVSWRTVEHEAHLEYQSLLKDLMLESDYLGGQA